MRFIRNQEDREMNQNIERLQTGELYNPADPELMAMQSQKLELLYDYNMTRPSQMERRIEILRGLLAEMGEGSYIEPSFRANWGGRFMHLGKHVYINMNLTLVDDDHIYIGDNSMFGPNVTVITGTHPVSPELRGENPLQYNLPVHIGTNCWIAAGVTILPGVTIGDNTVIGAGSVVTRDIPANVVAMGTPCRVIRKIDDNDRTYYYREREIDRDMAAFLRNGCETGGHD